MSQAEFENAKDHLEQAKQNVIQALNFLNDSAANLDRYKLTQEELDRLHHKFQFDLEDIRTNLIQQTSEQIEIGQQSSNWSDDPASFQGKFGVGTGGVNQYFAMEESAIVGSAIVGEIPPDDFPDQIVGEIPPDDFPDQMG